MEKTMIDISGLEHAAVLAALYNASKPQGLGFMHYKAESMTMEQAADILKTQTYFDYLHGRVMKIEIAGAEIDPRWYDRDNGNGAAAQAIEQLRHTSSVNSEVTQENHRSRTLHAAADLMIRLGETTETSAENGIAVVTLGLADVADELEPQLDAVIEKL